MQKMAFIVAFVGILACAHLGGAQAITGFTGGSEFGIYYGSSLGDVVGFRFTVSDPLEVTDLGAWDNDTIFPGFEGLTTAKDVGIWDSTQTLLTSVTVTSAGTVIGDWIYESITPITLMPGETYTIGAVYTDNDNDGYISGASAVTSAAEVTWVNAVYPSAGDLGFVFPALDTGASSGGRFGPNFVYAVVPVELMSFSVE